MLQRPCCEQCGCSHPALVDEYYFWLIDGRLFRPAGDANPVLAFGTEPPGDYQFGYQDDLYDPIQQEAAYWQDPDQLPQSTRMAGSRRWCGWLWCRIHNGEFQQPRTIRVTAYRCCPPTAPTCSTWGERPIR